jgi:folate-binding protein YgfZ
MSSITGPHAPGPSVRPRPDLALLSVRGDDARTWLNGQITNDVRATKPGDAVCALVLNVKGRILADVVALDRGERGLAVIVPRSELDALRAHLEKYIIMEDVELVLESLSVAEVRGTKPDAAIGDAYAAPWLGEGAWIVIAEGSPADALVAAGAVRADEAMLELDRVRAGRPRFGLDFGITSYPQEAGLDSAVSFQKGCYLGQEVVCMLENRGQLSRALVRLALDAKVEVGAKLHDGHGAEVGTITSVATDDAAHETLALGYLKRAAIADGAIVKVGEHDARVLGRAHS